MDYHFYISLLHIFLISPLLVYIGTSYGKTLNQQWFNATLFTGVAVSLYHIYKVYEKGSIKKGWIYALHALLFGPLLIYIGYYQREAFHAFYTILTMIGFAGLGFHLMKVYKTIMKMYS